MRLKNLYKSTLYVQVLAITFVFHFHSSAQIGNLIDDFSKRFSGKEELTTNQVIEGLKEALIQGISNGSDQASAIDGYLKNSLIKIAFPPDARKVESRLRQIGLGPEVDKFIVSLNRGAERAAKEAKPIFVEAIRSMSIEDAWGILNGGEHSATQYLKESSYQSLNEKFQPIITDALEEVSATKYYDDLVHSYNKIPFVKKANPDLDQYATEQAIEGLFLLIAEEEAKIRKDPGARATELLNKVFGH
jgi:hypothetical protein